MNKIKTSVFIALMALTMSLMVACGNTNTGTNSTADNTAGTTNDTATGTVNDTTDGTADNTVGTTDDAIGTTDNDTVDNTIGDEADNVNDVTAGDYGDDDSLLDDAGEVVGDVGNTAADIIDDTANGVENAVDDVTNDSSYSATGTSTSSRSMVR